ncbi:O-antigen ligase family protein [Ideonella sp.]|uniref:O-antigen ligase family protein n=1 Tax=Ideonella sp. TaxID=1929293 RepID=UPI0035B14C86
MTTWPLLAYLAAVPWALLAVPGNVHDLNRMVQVVVMAAMAVLLIHRRSASAPSRVPPLGWLALGLAAASVAASAVPAEALKEALLLGGLLLLGLASGRAASADRDRWLAAVAIGSAVYAGLLVGGIVLALAVGLPLDARDIVVGFVNYRFLSHTQTVAMPLLAVTVVLAHRWPLVRTLAAFALVVQAMFIPALGARATGLALLSGMGVVALLGPASARRVVGTLAAAMLGGAALYAIVFSALPNWVGVAADATTQRSAASLSSDGSRAMLWRLAWEQAWSAPWLGQGPMHYAHVPNAKAAHPHNMYLQVAAEWGFPMLMIALTTAGGLLRRLAKRLRSERQPAASAEGAALAIAACAVLVDGAFSGNFVMPVPQMWVALGLGWAWAWATHQPSPAGPPAAEGPPASGRWARAVWVGVLVGQLLLAGIAAMEYATLDERLRRVRTELADNPRDNPRFWSHGWF